MKESIGNAFLFNIVIVFVSMFCLLFAGSSAYSKAFLTKNSIIDNIEFAKEYNDDVKYKINRDLKAVGYRTRVNDCKNLKGIKPIQKKPDYDYCIYEISDGNVGKYYKVVTYMRIDLPLLGNLGIPVSGETMTFRNDR